MGVPAISLLLLAASLAAVGQTEMADSPSKGEWDFALQEVWEIDGVDGQPFGRIAELLVLRDGGLHVRDFTTHVSHLFAASGEWVASVGRHGEAAGELSRYLNRFATGDGLVLGAPEALHFFSADGTYRRSFPNDLFQRFPLLFLDETTFVYAPPRPGSSESQARLVQADLASGQEGPLLDFAEPVVGAAEVEAGRLFIQVLGLTPSVVLASDGEQLYFGKNDSYTIHVTDLAGAELHRFALNRQTKAVSVEAKRRHFSGSRMKPEQIEDVVAKLPDRLVHFHRIQPVGELLYVFTIGGIDRRFRRQGIDVFSRQGEYLYRGSVDFGGGAFFAGPSNLAIGGEHLYVILEDDDRARIVKYKIAMPKP